MFHTLFKLIIHSLFMIQIVERKINHSIAIIVQFADRIINLNEHQLRLYLKVLIKVRRQCRVICLPCCNMYILVNIVKCESECDCRNSLGRGIIQEFQDVLYQRFLKIFSHRACRKHLHNQEANIKSVSYVMNLIFTQVTE